MADESLTYRLFGQDVSASRALRGVGDESDRTGSKVEGFGSKAGGALGKVGTIAGTAIAGAAVGAVLGLGAAMVSGVQSAISYETLGKKTEAVLTSTGNAANTSVQGIQDLAASLESMSGVDEELIINGQNVLATFTNVTNAAGEGNDIFDQATASALDMSVALGTDLQGANIQLGKALNDPIKGITALSRVGVSFTAQQKDQIKALVKSGDSLGAQKLILAELNKEFGGAAKAAGEGFAGSMARLQDAGSDLFRTLGEGLLPVITDMANGLNDLIAGFGEASGGDLQEFLLILTDLSATVGDDTSDLGKLAYVVRVTLVGAFQTLWGIVKAVIGWWRTYLEPAFRKVAAELLPKLQAMFRSVGKTMDEHQDIVRAVQAAFKILGMFFQQILIPVLGKIAGAIISVVGPAFKVWAQTVSTVVIPALKWLVQAVMLVIQATLDAAAKAFGWIPGLGPKLQAAAKNFGKFRNDVNAALDGIQDETVTISVFTKADYAAQALLKQYRNSGKLQALERIAARARGGPTTANRPYLIGEEGPELFVPASNGYVVPNDKLLGAARTGAAIVPGQRGGDVYNISVQGFVGSEAQLVKLMRQASDRTKARGYGFALT